MTGPTQSTGVDSQHWSTLIYPKNDQNRCLDQKVSARFVEGVNSCPIQTQTNISVNERPNYDPMQD